MKFIHFADMHFDAAFTLLSAKENLGIKRRMEQRQIFNNIIEKVKQEQAKYLFIAGDLYEQTYIRESTIEFINNKFKEIPDTHIYIAPGNHDPYIKNSYYNTYEWAKNVHIFNKNLELIETPEVDVYGYGFTDYTLLDTNIENLNIKNKNKINVLITHGTLDGSTGAEKLYNPVKRNSLERLGFDYIALGHIHKTNLKPGERIVYPSSPVSLGFDELYEHGIIVGELTKEKLETKFIETDTSRFIEKCIDITTIKSQEELIEEINNLSLAQNEFCKIYLTGTKNFDINNYSILKSLENSNILKLKDATQIPYNLEELQQENTLKGIFVKNLLEKAKQNPENTEIQKAIEIGLSILE